MSKLENQWIEIFRAGDYAEQGKFTEADLDQIVRNYQASNPEFEDAPASIGHPEGSGAPAWAWWSAIKREGKLLLGKMKDVQPQFEEMVENRMFPKRSIGLVKRQNSGWNLHHVAFLGAKAPQVKGLADCKFSDRTGLTHVEFEEKFDTAKAMKGVNSRIPVDENSVKLHAAVTEFCEREKVDFATGCAKVLERDSRLSAPAGMRGVNHSRIPVDENSVKLHADVTEFCEKEKVDYATGCIQVLERDSRLQRAAGMKLHPGATEFYWGGN